MKVCKFGGSSLADAAQLAETFRGELRDDTVYALTPQGRVIDLPAGSTPVGNHRLAEVAGPPSPEKPHTPLPATVSMRSMAARLMPAMVYQDTGPASFRPQIFSPRFLLDLSRPNISPGSTMGMG